MKRWIFGSTVYFAMIMTAAIAQGQPPDTAWVRYYGGSGDEQCVAIHNAGNGFFIAGNTNSQGAGESDFWLVKVDSLGNEIWNRTYGGLRWDSLAAIENQPDSTVGYLLVGSTRSYGGGGADFWMIRVNMAGGQTSDHTYGERGDQNGRAAHVSDDGSVMLVGDDIPFMEDISYTRIIKTLPNGTPDWETGYGDTTMLYMRGVGERPTGGFLAAGFEEWPAWGDESSFPIILKLSSLGHTEQALRFTGLLKTRIHSARPNHAGGLLLAGRMKNFSHGEPGNWRESVLMNVNENGSALYTVYCGFPYDDELVSAVPTNDGGAIGVGWKNAPEDPYNRAFIVRVNGSGNTLWTKILNFDSTSVAQAVLPLNDGSYLVAGTKLMPNGGTDVWLAKLNPELAAEPEPIHYPAEFKLYPGYPNPFNSRAVIEYDLPRAEFTRLVVYDILGREAALLAEGYRSAGRHRATFDGANLPSGIYLCRLQAGTQTAVQKLVMMK